MKWVYTPIVLRLVIPPSTTSRNYEVGLYCQDPRKNTEESTTSRNYEVGLYAVNVVKGAKNLQLVEIMKWVYTAVVARRVFCYLQLVEIMKWVYTVYHIDAYYVSTTSRNYEVGLYKFISGNVVESTTSRNYEVGLYFRSERYAFFDLQLVEIMKWVYTHVLCKVTKNIEN